MAEGYEIKRYSAKEISRDVLPKLFNDINFDKLNSAIETLGSHSDIKEDQRSNAIEIISSWQQNVIAKLSSHKKEVDNFTECFGRKSKNRHEGTYYHNDLDMFNVFGEAKLMALASSTDTVEEFEKLVEKRKDYDTAILDAPFDDLIEDPDKTAAELIMERADLKKSKTLHELKVTRCKRDEIKAEREWKASLLKNDGIREMLAKCEVYSDKVDDFKQDCITKAQAAKLNINISNAEVRKALREMIDFTKSI